eukprot:TRINITY_DN865_c0_g1_i10.p4 TRINITY_DN865_c0_g1~~TRINITY_DN865_c0_g1_i10.p4  ORF type:complete len:116 (-),score=15.55 TRINITY_DN865_c0_g1_i10:50-397(-)
MQVQGGALAVFAFAADAAPAATSSAKQTPTPAGKKNPRKSIKTSDLVAALPSDRTATLKDLDVIGADAPKYYDLQAYLGAVGLPVGGTLPEKLARFRLYVQQNGGSVVIKPTPSP